MSRAAHTPTPAHAAARRAALRRVARVGSASSATMYVFASSGRRCVRRGALRRRASRRFGRLETVNVIDPSLALVGVGDARYRQGDLLGAEDAFADALDEAPGDCEVRFNLAVTIEAQGDRLRRRRADRRDVWPAVRPVDRSRRSRRALLDRAAISWTPASARRSPPTTPATASPTTRERIVAKLAALDEESGDKDRPDPEAPPRARRGDSEQIDDVELRNQAGANQREDARDRDTSRRHPRRPVQLVTGVPVRPSQPGARSPPECRSAPECRVPRRESCRTRVRAQAL